MNNKARVIALIFCAIAATPVAAVEQRVFLQVDGMTGAQAAEMVQTALEAVDGVEYVKVSYPQRTAEVSYEDRTTTLSMLLQATARAGFPAVEKQAK